MNIAQAMASVVTRLSHAGIRATTDERDVNPPCVFVPAPAVVFRFGGRCWDATYALVCVVPDAGRLANLTALGELLDATNRALDGGCIDGAPVSFAGVEGSPPLPAYTLRLAESID